MSPNLNHRYIKQLALILIGISISFTVYRAALPLENIDYKLFLQLWIEHIHDHGLTSALRERVSNYTAPYLVYLSAFVSLLTNSEPLQVLKASGLLLHLWLAFVTGVLLSRFAGSAGPDYGLAIFFMAIAPTSLVNCLVWGQADALYASFVVIAFFLLIDRRPLLSILFFGAALSIKLVAVFFLPFLVFHLINQRQFRLLLSMPLILIAVYFLMNAPYILAGLSFRETALIYADQADTYEMLSMNAPNIWFLFERLLPTADFIDAYGKLLIIGGAGAGVILGLAIVIRGFGPQLNLTLADNLLMMATIATIFPFILPKMHDRYFFLADTFIWVLAATNRRFLPAAVLVQLGSLLTYSVFLIKGNDIELPFRGGYLIVAGTILIATGLLQLLLAIRVRFRKSASTA